MSTILSSVRRSSFSSLIAFNRLTEQPRLYSAVPPPPESRDRLYDPKKGKAVLRYDRRGNICKMALSLPITAPTKKGGLRVERDNPSIPVLPAPVHGFRALRRSENGFRSVALSRQGLWYAQKNNFVHPKGAVYPPYVPPSPAVERMMNKIWLDFRRTAASQGNSEAWVYQWYIHSVLCSLITNPDTFFEQGTLVAYPLVKDLSCFLAAHKGQTIQATDLNVFPKMPQIEVTNEDELKAVNFMFDPGFKLINYEGYKLDENQLVYI